MIAKMYGFQALEKTEAIFYRKLRRQIKKMAKRPQSGDIDIDFDHIFTHSFDLRIRVIFSGEGGQHLPSRPPAEPAGQTQGNRRRGRG